MEIEVLAGDDAFERLREPWEDLSARARHSSVFTSWTWQRIWWEHYGQGQPLRILVARESDRVVGILPLYQQAARLMSLVRVRLWRNVGTGGDTAPDDLDPLLDPDYERETATAFAAALAPGWARWDVLRISDLAPASPLKTALTSGSWQACSTVLSRGANIAYLPLPASWDEFLRTLSRERRSKLRNRRRHFEAQPGARFFVWQDLATLDRAVDRLIELHHKRWQGRAEGHAFASERYVGFHRAVMRACLERDLLRLYCLEIEGAVVAMYYCYSWREGVFHFQGGFDPAIAQLRPGQVLMAYAIEHAIGEGRAVFDMLRGDYDYKSEWTQLRRQTLVVQAHARALPGLGWRLRYETLPRIKRVLLGQPGMEPVQA